MGNKLKLSEQVSMIQDIEPTVKYVSRLAESPEYSKQRNKYVKGL
jgi:hypothetical protein